jgi:putative spermidine/putrescine transport system permease protein
MNARERRPWILLLPALLTLAVFAIAFTMFVSVSLRTQVAGGAVFAGPANLANYREALASPAVQDAAWNTVRLAGEMTLLTALLGYPLAYVVARSPSPLFRRAVLFGLVLTLLSGGVTRAYAWLVLLGNRGLFNQTLAALGLPTFKLVHNETGVVIGVVHFLLPFFVLTLLAALRGIPISLEDAARNLRSSRWRAFVHVVLPPSIPPLVAAASLSFAGALSAFLFPELLGGGRVRMAANLIYERIITDYNLPRVAAMAALFLILALAALAMLAVVQRAFAQRFAGPVGGVA